MLQVSMISCGDEHTAVVTSSGRLFTFGCNEWGQLGLGHNNNVIKPSCVKVKSPHPMLPYTQLTLGAEARQGDLCGMWKTSYSGQHAVWYVLEFWSQH